uniref:Tudor domain-containing protein n=1 Tax=Steinernema glaseri TaxID=37863 RepID=A0A1I7YYI4_9BILA
MAEQDIVELVHRDDNSFVCPDNYVFRHFFQHADLTYVKCVEPDCPAKVGLKDDSLVGQLLEQHNHEVDSDFFTVQENNTNKLQSCLSTMQLSEGQFVIEATLKCGDEASPVLRKTVQIDCSRPKKLSNVIEEVFYNDTTWHESLCFATAEIRAAGSEEFESVLTEYRRTFCQGQSKYRITFFEAESCSRKFLSKYAMELAPAGSKMEVSKEVHFEGLNHKEDYSFKTNVVSECLVTVYCDGELKFKKSARFEHSAPPTVLALAKSYCDQAYLSEGTQIVASFLKYHQVYGEFISIEASETVESGSKYEIRFEQNEEGTLSLSHKIVVREVTEVETPAMSECAEEFTKSEVLVSGVVKNGSRSTDFEDILTLDKKKSMTVREMLEGMFEIHVEPVFPAVQFVVTVSRFNDVFKKQVTLAQDYSQVTMADKESYFVEFLKNDMSVIKKRSSVLIPETVQAVEPSLTSNDQKSTSANPMERVASECLVTVYCDGELKFKKSARFGHSDPPTMLSLAKSYCDQAYLSEGTQIVGSFLKFHQVYGEFVSIEASEIVENGSKYEIRFEQNEEGTTSLSHKVVVREVSSSEELEKNTEPYTEELSKSQVLVNGVAKVGKRSVDFQEVLALDKKKSMTLREMLDGVFEIHVEPFFPKTQFVVTVSRFNDVFKKQVTLAQNYSQVALADKESYFVEFVKNDANVLKKRHSVLIPEAVQAAEAPQPKQCRAVVEASYRNASNATDPPSFTKLVDFPAEKPVALVQAMLSIFYEDTQWGRRRCYAVAEKQPTGFNGFMLPKFSVPLEGDGTESEQVDAISEDATLEEPSVSENTSVTDQKENVASECLVTVYCDGDLKFKKSACFDHSDPPTMLSLAKSYCTESCPSDGTQILGSFLKFHQVYGEFVSIEALETVESGSKYEIRFEQNDESITSSSHKAIVREATTTKTPKKSARAIVEAFYKSSSAEPLTHQMVVNLNHSERVPIMGVVCEIFYLDTQWASTDCFVVVQKFAEEFEKFFDVQGDYEQVKIGAGERYKIQFFDATCHSKRKLPKNTIKLEKDSETVEASAEEPSKSEVLVSGVVKNGSRSTDFDDILTLDKKKSMTVREMLEGMFEIHVEPVFPRIQFVVTVSRFNDVFKKQVTLAQDYSQVALADKESYFVEFVKNNANVVKKHNSILIPKTVQAVEGPPQPKKCKAVVECSYRTASNIANAPSFTKLVDFQAGQSVTLVNTMLSVFYEDTQWGKHKCYAVAEKKSPGLDSYVNISEPYENVRLEDNTKYRIRFFDARSYGQEMLPKFSVPLEGNGTEPEQKPEDAMEVDEEEEEETVEVNFIKFKGMPQRNGTPPKMRTLLDVACPKCKRQHVNWVCVGCMDPVFFDFSDKLYCKCGAYEKALATYRCGDARHGDAYASHADHVFRNMKKCEEFNIVLMGETGAGKSTWIDAIFNYLLHETLDDAVEHNKLEVPIPTHFLLEDDDNQLKKIHVGEKNNNEDDQKERNVAIELNEKTMYYFDNESFKFLCAVQYGIEGLAKDKEDFVKSWDISASNTYRALDYIASLEPHLIRDMMSLNEAKRIILELTPISAEITKNIQMNKRMIEAKKVELQEMKKQYVDLKSQLSIKQTSLEVVPINYPKTVCASRQCIETIAIPGSTESQTLYKTICHAHCYLNNIEPGRYPNPGLQGCAAMAGKMNCQGCGCSWETHLHIRYEQKQVTVEVTNKEVDKVLDSKNSDEVLVVDVIKGLETRLEELGLKEKRIKTICAKFVAFLNQNAIAVVNDAYGEYLEQSIKLAKNEVAVAGEDNTKVEQLEKYLAEYREEVAIIKEHIKNGTESITVTSIEAMKQELEQMEELGDQFKKFLQVSDQAQKSYKREDEVHLNSSGGGFVSGLVDMTKNAYKWATGQKEKPKNGKTKKGKK